MVSFGVNKAKTVNAVLYILSKLNTADYHKIFKVLYFAEKEHLKTYGQPLTGDAWLAMNYGPVPSFLYDVFKAAEKGTSPYSEASVFAKFFQVDRSTNVPMVIPMHPADMDELSQSNVQVLDHAIEDNRDLSFSAITEKSHDKAWTTAFRLPDTEMTYIEIAKSAHATAEMLEYIKSNAENTRI